MPNRGECLTFNNLLAFEKKEGEDNKEKVTEGFNVGQSEVWQLPRETVPLQAELWMSVMCLNENKLIQESKKTKQHLGF